MGKIAEIKAVQIAAALDEGKPNPYDKGGKPTHSKELSDKPKPAGSNKPVGKLAKIKAAQLEEADKTGINPYDRTVGETTKAAKTVMDLAHYQDALSQDIAKISAQKDIADKLRVKQSVLPTYLPFVDQYVDAGDNYPNDVAVQVMIWLLDIGEIEHGLNLALVLIDQRQRMPAKFDRDMPTFLCDFFYDWANQMLKDEHSASPYLDTVIATAEAEKWDVHPLCISKLCAMLAKHKECNKEYREALTLCEKAEAVNPEKAGVKGLKERLQKELKGNE